MLQPDERKPNVIFDVTLKNMSKVNRIADTVKFFGYDPTNTHIVWVIQHIEIAQKQNNSRKRVVPEEILLHTHKGAGSTTKAITKDANSMRKVVDGDVWFLFNQPGIDSNMVKSGRGGSYFTDVEYVKVKEAGRSVDYNTLTDKVVEKIRKYVPNPDSWEED